MNWEKRIREKARKHAPRLGSVLIPESAAKFMPDPTGMPGAASDVARYGVAQGFVPGYQAPAPAPAPAMPGMMPGQAPRPAPQMPGQLPGQLAGPNPFAAKARQAGLADFQSAQASALRGGAKNG